MARTGRALKRRPHDFADRSLKTIEKDLSTIKRLYKVKNPGEVREFLLSKRHLVDVLMEIPEKASQYFPSNKGITLEFKIDPEEGYEEIIVRILINLDPDSAIEALKRFDEEWWLNEPKSHLMDICVNIGYS